MPQRPETQPQQLVDVSVCIAPFAMRFGPEPSRRGGRHDCRSGGVAAALASSQVWLRSADGHRLPLERRAGGRHTSGVQFSGTVPAGSYVLCATPVGAPFRFPPRTLTVEPGPSVHTFRLVEGDSPFVRLGTMLVPFGQSSPRLAVVLRTEDDADDAVARIRHALAAHHYEPVIDLTRPIHTDEPAADPEPPFWEFVAVADRAAPPASELSRLSPAVAEAAGLAAGDLRLGCLLRTPHGPVMVDNEIVLGFAHCIDADGARRQVAAAGGRVLEDLGDPEVPGPVLVARFDDATPEAALTLAESWLDGGLLHWAEPNVVEHW